MTVFSPMPKSKPGRPELYFVWAHRLICLVWVVLPAAYTPASMALRAIATRNSPTYFEAVVLDVNF
jgi:hypothetical protein